MNGEGAGPAGARARPPAVPTPPRSLSLVSLACVLGTIAATLWIVAVVRQVMGAGGIGSLTADLALYAFAAATLLLLVPAVQAVRAARRAERAVASDLVAARVETAAATSSAWVALGYAAATWLQCTLSMPAR